MKAVVHYRSLPIADPEALVDATLPEPVPGPRDLLVDVKAISVNPVDTKVRMRAGEGDGTPRLLGWDVAGEVVAVGADVRRFRVGDRAWYAGSLTRPGANAERHVVDERIVGHAPSSRSFAEAAALPLTTITAWELLFDRLKVAPGKHHHGDAILVIGASGGVGSILVQLARRLTGLTVIGTASRPETRDWVTDLGAHAVIDHAQPLAAQVAALGLGAPRYVASLRNTDRHFAQIAELIAPQGDLALIDDPAPGAIDIGLLKRKSVALHWEFMYTRSMFETPDMAAQGDLLDEVGQLVDAGVIRTTVGDHFGRIDAANLRRAHALLESGKARGKIVLENF